MTEDLITGSKKDFSTCRNQQIEIYCNKMSIPNGFVVNSKPVPKRLTFAYCEVKSCRAVREDYGIGYICWKCGHTQTTYDGYIIKDNNIYAVNFNNSNDHLIREELFSNEIMHFPMSNDDFDKLVNETIVQETIL